MNKSAYVLLSVVLASALGCSSRASTAGTKPDFAVLVRASSDDEQPLANVAVSAAGHFLGATAAAGTLPLRISGHEGQVLPVTLTCPEGYSPPNAAPPLRLTQARALGSGKAEPLVYDIVCDRKKRSVVVAVKASGLKGAPVLINGERQAVTDENGIAHVALTVDRDTPAVRVDLDTSAEPALAPQNPGRTYALNRKDSLFIFEQSLSRRTRPKPKARPAAPARHVPQRLD